MGKKCTCNWDSARDMTHAPWCDLEKYARDYRNLKEDFDQVCADYKKLEQERDQLKEELNLVIGLCKELADTLGITVQMPTIVRAEKALNGGKR